MISVCRSPHLLFVEEAKRRLFDLPCGHDQRRAWCHDRDLRHQDPAAFDTAEQSHAASAGGFDFADLGGEMLPGTPKDFASLIVSETEKWAKVVKSAGLKPE